MPASRHLNVYDLTGRIGRELHRKAKAQTEKRLAAYQSEIEQRIQEIEDAKRPIPVAAETYNEEDVIDYTGDYHGIPTE